MVARNFFEGPFDLMHPKVDMAGYLYPNTGKELTNEVEEFEKK